MTLVTTPKMPKFLGVDWVDMTSIPLQRRLQMTAVVLHLLTFSVIPILLTLLFLYLLFTSYWWVTVGYAAWMYWDIYIQKSSARGGKQSQWIRTSTYFHYFRDYFPIHLIKTADLDPNANYVMGYHPHGIIGCGAFGNFGSDATGFSEKFPGITPHVVTLEANFRWPIIRAYALWCGMYKQIGLEMGPVDS